MTIRMHSSTTTLEKSPFFGGFSLLVVLLACRKVFSSESSCSCSCSVKLLALPLLFGHQLDKLLILVCINAVEHQEHVQFCLPCFFVECAFCFVQSDKGFHHFVSCHKLTS